MMSWRIHFIINMLTELIFAAYLLNQVFFMLQHSSAKSIIFKKHLDFEKERCIFVNHLRKRYATEYLSRFTITHVFFTSQSLLYLQQSLVLLTLLYAQVFLTEIVPRILLSQGIKIQGNCLPRLYSVTSIQQED